MDSTDSLDFEWGGIAFRLLPRPRPGSRSNAPVLLRWRHPSGEAGSRRFARLSDAMLHSSRMTEAAGSEQRLSA